MLLALFIAGVGGLYLMVRGYAQQTADTAYDQLLRASALSIADSLQLVDDEWRMDMPYAALALLEQAPRDRVFYQVRAGDGALVSGYPDLPDPPADGASDDAASSRLFKARYQDQPVRFAWMERKIAGPAGTRSARPGRPDERGTRCAGRAGAVARHAGAAGLHRRRAGAGLVGPAPFAGADPPHRARAGRARRVRPATHQGARAGRAGHAGAYTGRLHGAAGGKPGHAAPVHRRGRASAAHAAGRAARADGSGAGRGRPAEQRRSLLAVLRNAENCRGWSTSCSATPA